MALALAQCEHSFKGRLKHLWEFDVRAMALFARPEGSCASVWGLWQRRWRSSGTDRGEVGRGGLERGGNAGMPSAHK
jgi:hypothetical protein